MRWPSAAILALVISAQTTVASAKELNVRQVHTDYGKLDGKVVTIRGWMGSCWNMDCTLYATPDLTDESERRTQSLVIGPKGKTFRERAKFDALLNSYHGQEIVLEAKFDATCITGICLDRASVLNPIRVVRVIGANRKATP